MAVAIAVDMTRPSGQHLVRGEVDAKIVGTERSAGAAQESFVLRTRQTSTNLDRADLERGKLARSMGIGDMAGLLNS